MAATILTKTADWTPESVLVFDARNTSEFMTNVHVVFAGESRSVTVRIGIFPDWKARIALPLETAGGRTLFLKRTPGRFKTVVAGGNLSVEDLREIRVGGPPGGEADVEISALRIDPRMPDEYPLPDRPLVDELHQWRAKTWPGKADSLDAVAGELNAELRAPAPEYPDEWSRYGGWKGKTFGGTGFFRAQHDGNRWWLADPEGHAFWSIGVDCITPSVDVNVTGIESLFDPPLPSAGEAPDLRHSRGGMTTFNAMQHNLRRTLGPDAGTLWPELTRRRLKAYRFNTIANWSDARLHGVCRIPYVITMGGFPGTPRPLFRDFPDVYAPEYAANCRDFARQLAPLRENPFVIGYFMTNEPQWAFMDGFDVGYQVLQDDRPSATREAFIGFLAERHGSVDALNAAWGTAFASFDDLWKRWDLSAVPAAKADTAEFTRGAVDRYVRTPAEACKAVDPNHMNLGLRWAWIHSESQLAAADCLDAFSINCYRLKPDPQQIADLARKTGKPMMIGEYHIGCLELGLPAGGIHNVRTLRESADAYRYYLENAAAIPDLVGAHYFQWNDQHVLGRFDGENMQIGLHDVTCRPHRMLTDMCRQVHPEVYRIAAGLAEPFATMPVEVPDGTLCR